MWLYRDKTIIIFREHSYVNLESPFKLSAYFVFIHLFSKVHASTLKSFFLLIPHVNSHVKLFFFYTFLYWVLFSNTLELFQEENNHNTIQTLGFTINQNLFTSCSIMQLFVLIVACLHLPLVTTVIFLFRE
jgi:hypothetical protein